MGVTQIAEAQLAELRIKVSTYQCQRDLEESFRTIIKASKEQDKLIEEAENMKGEKFDTKKTRYDLIPVKALEEVAKVLTHGADKYSDNNWRQVEDAHKRYTAAAMRHGELYRGGVSTDHESHLHHLAHRICCDLFLLQLDLEDPVSYNQWESFENNRSVKPDGVKNSADIFDFSHNIREHLKQLEAENGQNNNLLEQ